MAVMDKLIVYPTQGMHSTVACRLAYAQRGHDLLKKRVTGFSIRYRTILSQLIQDKCQMNVVMKNALFSLAEVKYIAGDINQFVLHAVDKARIKVCSKQGMVAGTKIRSFECYEEGTDSYQYAGLSRGGQQIAELKKIYRTAVELFTRIAALQHNFIILEESIKRATHRVNILKYFVIPKLERTRTYIANELDEYEREEFFRLKKVQNKKRTPIKSENIEETQRTFFGSIENISYSVNEDALF